MPYISNGQRWTYGVKTLSELDSLTGMVTGETVFCSDAKRPMTYDGDVWMCGDFVKMTNSSGGTLGRGDVVVVDTAEESATTTTTNADDNVLGVVVFGATNTNPMAVAIFGLYDVKTDATTCTPGDYCKTDNVAGWTQTTTTMGTGFFGIMTEQKSAAGSGGELHRMWIRPTIEMN